MMAVNFDYSRAGRPVSSRSGGFSRRGRARIHLLTVAALAIAASLPVAAQYAGKVPEQSKTKGPDLRAVAVLEWTGDPGHPKASRLVPITLWDGEELQDASIYMAQPEPLALQSDVEYELKENGKTIGYYDVSSAGQSQNAWVGFGAWKPLTPPKPVEAAKPVTDLGGDDSGRPVLHRASHADDSSKSSAPEPAPDPDRPRLSEPKKKTDSAKNPQNDVAYSQPIANVPDPDRPHLSYGKSSNSGPAVLPTLAGLPPDMHQTIAVSETGDHPDHIWTYSWTSPDEEAKMKSEMEEMARKALAPASPPAAPQPEHHHTTTTRHRTRTAAAPPPLPLEDEQFHVFQLTYGGPATMIFSAHTTGSGAQEKFVTVIGQPDLYGNAMMQFKHVTSADNLDSDPAMRLVDPVDAMADNRGELLFELRGATQREFALYRVVNGQVQKLFTSLPESVAMPAAPPAS